MSICDASGGIQGFLDFARNDGCGVWDDSSAAMSILQIPRLRIEMWGPLVSLPRRFGIEGARGVLDFVRNDECLMCGRL